MNDDSGAEIDPDEEPDYSPEHYSRVRVGEIDGIHVYEVAVVVWRGHEPYEIWKRFRRWRRPPSQKQLDLAWKRVLEQKRFFVICERCQKLNNVGHMDGSDRCQACAEKEGVVY